MKTNNEVVLVTGANGFLGSHILQETKHFGFTAYATDINSHSQLENIKYFQADITEPGRLSPVMKSVDAVIHTAGLAHIFDKKNRITNQYHTINAIGTANVLQAAIDADVKHFLLISSVSVYGRGLQVIDENSPCTPLGAYAESKYQAELYAIDLAQKADINLTILRLATLFGEGDPGNVARLMRAIDTNRFIWIGDGSNFKSLLYVDDAARAVLTALSLVKRKLNIYNVSSPPCKMRQVVDGLALALNRKIPDIYIPANFALSGSKFFYKIFRGKGRMGNLYSTLIKWLEDDLYDASKFNNTYNYQTQVSLNDGLDREVRWYRNNIR